MSCGVPQGSVLGPPLWNIGQYVTNKHFCAGFVSTGGGACNKDLGGPGVVGGELVGVISFGAPLCGAIDAPTVFTKLGHYAKWIDSIVALERPSIAKRTTHSYDHGFRYFVDPEKPPPSSPYRTTRGYIEPLLVYSEENGEEFKHVVRRRTTPRTRFGQLFPYTPTTRFPIVLPIELIRNWLYNDYGIVTEDVNDMFKTTRVMESAMKHPLVNKSLVPIPGVHSINTQKEKYSPIRLTTSAYREDLYQPEWTRLPSPELTPRPLLTTSFRIVDLLTAGEEFQTDTAWKHMVTTARTTRSTVKKTATVETATAEAATAEAATAEAATESSETKEFYYSETEENITLRFRDYYN